MLFCWAPGHVLVEVQLCLALWAQHFRVLPHLSMRFASVMVLPMLLVVQRVQAYELHVTQM